VFSEGRHRSHVFLILLVYCIALVGEGGKSSNL